VDDRALNRRVWDVLAARVAEMPPPVRALEVGAGIGTMIERCLEWSLLSQADYTALDASGAYLDEARGRLRVRAGRGSFALQEDSSGMTLARGEASLRVTFVKSELSEVLARPSDEGVWDLLLAHAFLDLVHLPTALPGLLGLLRPGGLFYFSLNFDGATIFEPTLDADLDARIEALYHRTMDRRQRGGLPSGDSRCGRRLLESLPRHGARILEAGSSDWVVFPQAGSYPEDEATFLHHILHTVEGALAGEPSLDPARFNDWLAARHDQVARGQLVYIAHQLDILGTIPG
jgi:SAM-dependent methyltransferase